MDSLRRSFAFAFAGLLWVCIVGFHCDNAAAQTPIPVPGEFIGPSVKALAFHGDSDLAIFHPCRTQVGSFNSDTNLYLPLDYIQDASGLCVAFCYSRNCSITAVFRVEYTCGVGCVGFGFPAVTRTTLGTSEIALLLLATTGNSLIERVPTLNLVYCADFVCDSTTTIVVFQSPEDQSAVLQSQNPGQDIVIDNEGRPLMSFILNVTKNETRSSSSSFNFLDSSNSSSSDSNSDSGSSSDSGSDSESGSGSGSGSDSYITWLGEVHVALCQNPSCSNFNASGTNLTATRIASYNETLPKSTRLLVLPQIVFLAIVVDNLHIDFYSTPSDKHLWTFATRLTLPNNDASRFGGNRVDFLNEPSSDNITIAISGINSFIFATCWSNLSACTYYKNESGFQYNASSVASFTISPVSGDLLVSSGWWVGNGSVTYVAAALDVCSNPTCLSTERIVFYGNETMQNVDMPGVSLLPASANSSTNSYLHMFFFYQTPYGILWAVDCVDEICTNFTTHLLDDGSFVVQPSTGLWEIAIVVGGLMVLAVLGIFLKKRWKKQQKEQLQEEIEEEEAEEAAEQERNNKKKHKKHKKHKQKHEKTPLL
eukprot:TRINITY_DN11635_c0_g1_i1.p1 TRINITY_DN11635_c0_g1~~TRINITY_DN11635_c0_g1_i1.p1  ORF type:complete len:595 (-),score=86.91 TRINITY_DN11635_c0_g1_i1:231-2015(-)